jgi:hypothetical protein
VDCDGHFFRMRREEGFLEKGAFARRRLCCCRYKGGVARIEADNLGLDESFELQEGIRLVVVR